jgi:hypothetical protein
MKILGTLTVNQSNWKHVYSSLLSFVNDEISFAQEQASIFYEALLANPNQSLADLTNEEHNDFHLSLIEQAIFKPETSKLYKPKKKHFKHKTNRVTSIDLVDFVIEFDKVTNSITLESIDFEDFDLESLMSDQAFLGQFINMVETISWPKKPGPNKTIRGCTLIYVNSNQESTQFYSKGSNPPFTPVQNSITLPEPKFLKASPLKKLSMHIPVSQEIHANPSLAEIDSEFI